MATRRKKASRAYSSPPCFLPELEEAALRTKRVDVRVKRVYDPPAASDGYRVLVDRLWPRGLTKQAAAVDEWLRDIAPSTALRKWFHQDRSRWTEFRQRYLAELKTRSADLDALRQRAARQRVTLLYGSRDAERNHAILLKEILEAKRPQGRRS